MENAGNDFACTLHAVSGQAVENRFPENGHIPILHILGKKYQTIVEKKRAPFSYILQDVVRGQLFDNVTSNYEYFALDFRIGFFLSFPRIEF